MKTVKISLNSIDKVKAFVNDQQIRLRFRFSIRKICNRRKIYHGYFQP